MNSLHRVLADAARELDSSGTAWALVGGLAVGARTEPRFTRDVDLAVAAADDEASEIVVRALLSRGYHVNALLEQTFTKRLATVRLMPPAGGRLVDLLFASSGIEAEVVEAAERLELVAGVPAPVARTGHLLAMKVLARNDATRPQDRLDLAGLLGVTGPAELKRCRQSLQLMMDRGYSRGRRLLEELDAALTEFAYNL